MILSPPCLKTAKPVLVLIASLMALLLSGTASLAVSTARTVVLRHVPCNLFSTDEPVIFDYKVKDTAPGPVQVDGQIADGDGHIAWKNTFPITAAGNDAVLKLAVGPLPRGYYVLTTSVVGSSAKPATCTFGVMEFVHRTAAEVRDGGYRFGLKWWGGVTDHRECEQAMVDLGFQWTRIVQNQGGDLTTAQMLTDFPMNAVIKIERFPKELYDDARYGPLVDWEAKYGKGAWTLKTLPKKEPYQELLRQQLALIPKEQKIFEIWNEPWDKMSPEDFATLSQWIAEVVLKDRPDAILGPNLLGNTSPFEYDARVVKAGGMKGMKMVALHPYATSEDRQFLRDYKTWMKQQTGTDIDIYVTEYGSHSTPQGPSHRTEEEQARRVVRQSLALYAEDVKAFMPHWLGQAEANPTYIEDWFGFLRKNEQPKPVMLAYANCARLIDASRYVGDLWYGPGVGAMLFEKKGVFTLALYTLGAKQDPGTAQKKIEVAPGVKEVTQVDMVGKETKLTTSGDTVPVTLTEAPLYLVGVSPELEKSASKELRPDRWPKPDKLARVTRTAPQVTAPPAFDTNIDSWGKMLQIGLANPKVAADDASGTGFVGWDEKNLYVGIKMRDNELLNTQPRAKLYSQDCVELFVSTEPRDSGSGFGPKDYQFFLAPTSGEGKPIVGFVSDRESGKVDDVGGATNFTAKIDKGWLMETAIPWTALGGIKPQKGMQLALEIRVNDADTSHPRFKIDPVDVPNEVITPTDPSTWSKLELQ
jgi:hypothetical protein